MKKKLPIAKGSKPAKPDKREDPRAKVTPITDSIQLRKNTNGTVQVLEDERTMTSKFNPLKSGKWAHFPTLLCEQCDARPEELGGTGQCKYFQKNSFCHYDNKYIKMYEHLDTRDINQIGQLVNQQVVFDTVLLYRTRERMNQEGGVPDRAVARMESELREWLKLARELMIPKIHAKQTEMFGENNQMVQMIKEVYMSGNPNEKRDENSMPTFGLKTPEQNVSDTVSRIRQQTKQEEENLL